MKLKTIESRRESPFPALLSIQYCATVCRLPDASKPLEGACLQQKADMERLSDEWKARLAL